MHRSEFKFFVLIFQNLQKTIMNQITKNKKGQELVNCICCKIYHRTLQVVQNEHHKSHEELLQFNVNNASIHMALEVFKFQPARNVAHGLNLDIYKKDFMPLFMGGVHLSQGQSHFEEAVYFFPLSSQKFLALILSTSEG